MKPRGYTLIEILIAGVLLTILLVPLGYVVIQTGAGRKRAEVAGQAMQLAREAWGVVAATPPDSLVDTSWNALSQGRSFRISIDVWDSSDALGAEPLLGSTRGQGNGSKPGSVFAAMDAAATPPKGTDPIELSICVYDLAAAPRGGDPSAWSRSAPSASAEAAPTDTVFCWRYLRSRYLVR